MTSESSGRRAPLLGLTARARLLLPSFLVLLVVLTVMRLCAESPSRALLEFRGPTMGTTYSVKVVAKGVSSAERQSLAAMIEGRLTEVNRLMSTYDPESELSRFNQHTSTRPFALSPETFEVFRVAQEVSELTGGAFDVTVGPLVAAWGFGATNRVPEPPLPEELAALRERVGYRLIEIDPSSRSVTKRHPETVCDLSAVAKGYAVDLVARRLIERGHTDFLIEVGGEMKARGEREGGGPWRVAIEQPEPAQRSIFKLVELADRALATSGDYRNYYDNDGVRFSHLIDPRSGRPIAHGLTSVSVVHPSAAHADALATGLGVLGAEEGYTLAERQGLAAYFIVREPDGGLRGIPTTAFGSLEVRDGQAQVDPADRG